MMSNSNKNSFYVARKELSEAGFALIQIAIGLAVAGLIVAGITQAYMVQAVSDRENNIAGKLANIETAINRFYQAGNAHYPCPARLNASESDLNYGESADCSAAGFAAMPECSSATWRTNEGVCKTLNDPDEAAVIGAVPFDTLKINFEDVLDPWSNKIVYVTNYRKTAAATFNMNSPTIELYTMDKSDDATEDQIPDLKSFDDPIDFLLISHGENGRGAFTKDGLYPYPCGASTDGYESENCNEDGYFFSQTDPDKLNTGARSLNQGATYYDDYTRYQIKVPTNLWFPNPTYTNHAMTLAEKVGIGTNQPSQAIHVKDGNLYASGEVRANKICNEALVDCFDPKLFTEAQPPVQCASPVFGDQAVLSLAQNRFFCNSAVAYGSPTPVDDGKILNINGVMDNSTTPPTPIIIVPNTDCYGSGNLSIGFDASGNMICL